MACKWPLYGPGPTVGDMRGALTRVSSSPPPLSSPPSRQYLVRAAVQGLPGERRRQRHQRYGPPCPPARLPPLLAWTLGRPCCWRCSGVASGVPRACRLTPCPPARPLAPPLQFGVISDRDNKAQRDAILRRIANAEWQVRKDPHRVWARRAASHPCACCPCRALPAAYGVLLLLLLTHPVASCPWLTAPAAHRVLSPSRPARAPVAPAAAPVATTTAAAATGPRSCRRTRSLVRPAATCCPASWCPTRPR